MTEIERLVEWLAETAFNAGYADCASTYDIPQRVTVIEADAANDAAKAALLAALKGAEGERDAAVAKANGIEADAIVQRIVGMSDEEILRLIPKEQQDADVLSVKLALANAEVTIAKRERDAAVAALRNLINYVEWHMPLSDIELQHPTFSKPMAEARAALASNSGGGDHPPLPAGSLMRPAVKP